MKLQFEKATVDDAEELIHIQDISYYLDHVKYGYCTHYHQSKQAMEDYIREDIVYKILANRKYVGEFIVQKPEPGKYYIHCLCIIPEYENQGIGQKAIQFMEEICKDTTIWEIKTPSDKVKNHYFFHKCGYASSREEIEHSVKFSYFIKKILQK